MKNKLGIIIRLSLTTAILIAMWLRYSWALYLSVTLLAVSNEITAYLLSKKRNL